MPSLSSANGTTIPANKTLLATDGAGTSLTGIPYTLTGTANQVILSASTGNITFTLPQDIATTSTPQFATIGIGAAANATSSMATAGNTLTGTSQRAFLTQTTANESCTVAFSGMLTQVRTKATSFTLALGQGVSVLDASVGAGSTITTLVGVDISAQTGGGTNNYGIKSVTNTGGNNPWNLFISGSAPNYLNGNVTIGTTTITSGATFNIELGGGTTSPVLGAATADIVSLAAVDKAAGDRRLRIQSEIGNWIGIGNDRINYQAATGYISIAGTDTLSLTTTLLTFTDALNIAVGTTTGTKIGTATTQKIGFWNVTPVVQPSAYTQTYSTASKTHPNATAATLTDNTAGTANTTLEALISGVTYATDVAAIRNNFADLAAMVNKLTADNLDLKKVVNQLIDDGQALGLLS